MTDASQKTFASMLQLHDEPIPRIDLSVQQMPRSYKVQEEGQHPIPEPIAYSKQHREINLTEQTTQDAYESTLIEIARLSRQWDYLDYCEILTRFHMAMIQNKEDDILKLKDALVKHPLHNAACFDKNYIEYTMLRNMIRK
jgi:hypothetical protein